MITWLPLPVLFAFSGLLYGVMYYLAGYRKKIVMTNLQRSFPEKGRAELRSIARRFYRHFCDQFVETMYLLHMGEGEMRKRIRFKNPELIDGLYARKQSIIAVFGHYGNWEWLGALSLHFPYLVCAVYKPLVDKRFDRLYIRLREKFGIKTVPMAISLKKILEYRDAGILTITLLLSDQRPIKRHIRYWTRFLNQDTPVLTGAERIAVKTSQAVVYFHIARIKRGYYELEFIPVSLDPGKSSPFEITEKFTRILEGIIREKPEYWLWTHRRWRHQIEKYKQWAGEKGITGTAYNL